VAFARIDGAAKRLRCGNIVAVTGLSYRRDTMACSGMAHASALSAFAEARTGGRGAARLNFLNFEGPE